MKSIDFSQHIVSTYERVSQLDINQAETLSITSKKIVLRQPEGHYLKIYVAKWLDMNGNPAESTTLIYSGPTEEIKVKVKSNSNDFTLFNSVLSSKLVK